MLLYVWDEVRYEFAEKIVQSWEVKQLASFLTVEHIAAMEQED